MRAGFLAAGAILALGQLENPTEVKAVYLEAVEQFTGLTVPFPKSDCSPVVQGDALTGWVDEAGRWHRDHGPALISTAQGFEKWYQHGSLHRDGGPAVESVEGKFWHKRGKLHRVDGPAVELKNGREQWYKDGVLHREDGPAVVIPNYGEDWYRNGKRHRDGGPATTYYFDGSKFWFQNGKLIKSELSEEMQDAARNHPVVAPKQ